MRSPASLWLVASAALVVVSASATPARGQNPAPSCEEVDAYHHLDFWVGEWDVYVGEQKVGTNRIEKILDGCAIVENWVDARGSEGRSLFYYRPSEETWKQVWVTENAMRTAGLKEKVMIERFEEGGVRFQGRVPLPDGTEAVDRTTLTPGEDGTVRQVIEVSTDEGETWRTNFDAVYRPADE